MADLPKKLTEMSVMSYIVIKDEKAKIMSNFLCHVWGLTAPSHSIPADINMGFIQN